ncbi:Uncharacterised protein [Streptococcus pneumoniae]|nr:Uncharacterised protein [Streptococcus pneumoniae]CJB98858.1 Uncharacterised protein [Streptococcus pneumoniae]CJG74471.1 Uncharacterised protein [Streptococcus pneumoniae]COT73081.1 Uncharacterised protein [Streptococcus pneumoniae]
MFFPASIFLPKVTSICIHIKIKTKIAITIEVTRNIFLIILISFRSFSFHLSILSFKFRFHASYKKGCDLTSHPFHIKQNSSHHYFFQTYKSQLRRMQSRKRIKLKCLNTTQRMEFLAVVSILCLTTSAVEEN